MSQKLGNWDELEVGALLFPFKENKAGDNLVKHNNERDYKKDSSFTESVSHWRVNKPVFNVASCINCYNCWIYCPDASIFVRDEKTTGIDYDHCKGCGVCVSVCPTNPKSLLMFEDKEELSSAISKWPKKGEERDPFSPSNE